VALGSNPAPALVVLAAGESSRLGRCKALVPLTPRTPLELLCAAGASLTDRALVPTLVITGAHHEEIAAAAPPGVQVERNPDWRSGRSGGVLLAWTHRPGRDLCIAPVDVPLVPASVFGTLLRAWIEAGSPSRGWLAPSFTPPFPPHGRLRTRFGHPVVIGRDLLQNLAAGGPAMPLRGLRSAANPVFSAPVDTPAILDDLDSPEDFSRLTAR
jgi:CTP:molybdopterin cytidylyltransferase MocA